MTEDKGKDKGKDKANKKSLGLIEKFINTNDYKETIRPIYMMLWYEKPEKNDDEDVPDTSNAEEMPWDESELLELRKELKGQEFQITTVQDDNFEFTHKYWDEIINKLYFLGKKMKVIKGKVAIPWSKEVIRTMLLSKKDDNIADTYFINFDRKQIKLVEAKISALKEAKSSLRKIYDYICNLGKFVEVSMKKVDPGDATSITTKGPAKDLSSLIKDFNKNYETYLKGKDVKLEPEDEVKAGGFTYVNFYLKKEAYGEILPFLKYSKWWTSIQAKVKLYELGHEDAEPIPTFRYHTILRKFIFYFIQVYTVLHNHPYIVEGRPEYEFKLLPEAEVLRKFLQMEFEAVQAPQSNTMSFKFNSRYDFSKYFSNKSTQDTKTLCAHYLAIHDHPIVRYLVDPLNQAISKLHESMAELEKNETWRIRPDFHKNLNFYAAIKEFDRNYYKCWRMLAWNYRLEQLLFVHEVVEWLYKSPFLKDFFTDSEKREVLQKEILPVLIAFWAALKKRDFIDFKHAKLSFNKVKAKHEELVIPELDEQDDKEPEKEMDYNILTHEFNSGEYYKIDRKSKKVISMREFLLQEIIPEGKRAAFVADLDKIAVKLYDIRDDVRCYIKSDIINRIWSKKPWTASVVDPKSKKTNTLPHFQSKKFQEVEEKEDCRKKTQGLKDKYDMRVREANREDNYVPYLKEWEESNMLNESHVKKFADMLQLSFLRTPYVMNNNKFKNEDRYSTLVNSDNCYEDLRVDELLYMVDTTLVGALKNNPELDLFIHTVVDYFCTLSTSTDQKKE